MSIFLCSRLAYVVIKTDIVSSLSVTTTDIPTATKQPQQHQIDSKVKDKDRNKPNS